MTTRFLAAAAMAMAAPLTMAQTAPQPVPAQAPPFTPAIGKEAVRQLAQEIEDNFVFPDVARRYAARLRERLAAGAYDSPADALALAKQVTDDLQAVAPDGHLKMIAPGAGIRPGPGQGPAGGGPAPRMPMPPMMEQAGWIAPGIAYVRFNAFMGDPQVLKDFAAFLDQTEGARALIIDARTHRGGGLKEMDVLFPRIFATPQTVMVMDTRASVAERGGPLPFASLVKVDAPKDLARTEHRVTPATPATAWAKTKIYYLTSPRTASAAEHLATVFKGTGRATLVGGTTAGAGHYGGTLELPGGFAAFIPFGNSYFPGGKSWEQVGVKPDIEVAPERALVEVLTREGVAPAEAETLSATHKPSGSMERRQPGRT
ncbi:S41 family peptidase [Sphingomonas sp.]|uniref:S41 family peptidase n=1 Tax=Sphingomonas sp. TaxID=28214 RepID=UPI001ECF7292|nr:S41 family peptidase [Sphingomonas sp.]MBX3594225.1 S41 family peptidase [Sphingomonas sp.]